jgi:GNAT superfamily N-acetyltransferase
MSENIRVVKELTDEERQRLFGWGENIFGVDDSLYRWRPKELHFILDVDGQAASHVGLIDHTVEVEGQPVRVAGVGAVVTAGDLHGRGYAQKTLRHAERFMCEEWKVEFGLLFCLDRLKPFYERQSWQLLSEPVKFDQPTGKMVSPLNVMVLPCVDRVWPAGVTDLCSLPW